MTALAAKYALIITLLVSGGLITSAGVQTYFTFRETRASLIALQNEKADAAAQRLDEFFRDVERQLEWLVPPSNLAAQGSLVPPAGLAQPGGAPPPAPPLERRSQDFFRLLFQLPNVTQVSFFDEYGQEQYRLTRQGTVPPTLDASREPLFTVARAGRIYYGPVRYRGGVAQSMTIAIPDGGPNRSVIAVDVDLAPVRGLVDQLRFGSAGYASLLDSDGKVIARPDAADLPPLDPAQALSVSKTVDPPGWTVVVAQPAAEVFAPLTALLVRTGVLILAGLVVSLAVSVVMARRLASPVERRLRESHALLERRVDERTRELSDALRELAIARDTALDATRNKSAFLASMSHELRTPLSAIIGFAEVLTETEMEIDEATHKEFLADILAAGRHLLQLINDILDISKVEAGRMEFVPEYFEVEPAVRGVAAVAKALTSRKHQRLDVRVEPASGVVLHDPARFKQVLFNLVSNGVKFTPDGGEIRVVARRDDTAWLEVSVADSGIGLKPEDQQRIFDEFQQVDVGRAGGSGGGASGREQAGTGLGLALVKRFIRLMGGEVWVESEVGRGATFTFRIPPVGPDGQPEEEERPSLVSTFSSSRASSIGLVS